MKSEAQVEHATGVEAFLDSMAKRGVNSMTYISRYARRGHVKGKPLLY